MLIDPFLKEQKSRRKSMERRKLYMKDTDITSAFLKQLAKDTTHCIYCGVLMVDYGDMYRAKTLDHIKALSRGGKHRRDNVRYICWTCNHDKNNLEEVVFMNKYVFPYPEVTVLDFKNGIVLLEINEPDN